MAKIYIGEQVKNKHREIGTITAFDDKYITVNYPSRTAVLVADAFEQGHIKYVNEELQNEVQECIIKNEQIKKQKLEEERVNFKGAKTEERTLPIKTPADIKFEKIIELIGPAPVFLNSVHRNDRELVQKIFNECEKDTQALYENFHPQMVYPKLTSHSRSKYCVGFFVKYLDTYVLRVFSRNDVYKKRVKTGITVMESNTAEVLRVVQINGNVYHFTKNIAVSVGYYNNTKCYPKWRGSKMGANVFLNEVICNCDCGYLNGYVADKKVNIQAFLFIKLLFLALVNNKAEIAFKNKAFASTYGIKNLADYLEEFTPKQIDFASKNDVLLALPFIKNFGISDVQLLRDLSDVMEERGYTSSVYEQLKRHFDRIGADCADLDRRLMNFVKNVEWFSAGTYLDYLREFNYLPAAAVTAQDLFDKNYIARHDTLLRERLARQEANSLKEERENNEKYLKAAKELAWIDREENGYFIIVPKSVDDFKLEGSVQHNCVYSLKYYNKVIIHNSIIVFLRQKKDVPYVTIEYDYNTFKVLQALGKYNKKIENELYQYIVNLGKQLYCEMHNHQ